jgi:hypothetical protein
MNLKSIAVIAAFALAAGSADAGVTFLSYGTALPGNEGLVTNFSNGFTVAPGFSFSGNGQLLTGTSGDGAAPAFGPSSVDPGQYLSILGGESETLTTPLLSEVSLYIGSLDNYNSITFSGPGGSTTYTGSQLGLVSGAANGNQTAANTNGRFVFSFSAPIDSITVSSGSNSFEIADIAGVPEPAAWAMMLLGFAGLGAGIRGAKRRVPAAA